MERYEVTCDNVGTVYAGDDRTEADRVFNEYVKLSDIGIGRPAGENVTIFERFPMGTAIVAEHRGWLSDSGDDEF
jgi:hypothetical protein